MTQNFVDVLKKDKGKKKLYPLYHNNFLNVSTNKSFGTYFVLFENICFKISNCNNLFLLVNANMLALKLYFPTGNTFFKTGFVDYINNLAF